MLSDVRSIIGRHCWSSTAQRDIQRFYPLHIRITSCCKNNLYTADPFRFPIRGFKISVGGFLPRAEGGEQLNREDHVGMPEPPSTPNEVPKAMGAGTGEADTRVDKPVTKSAGKFIRWRLVGVVSQE